MNVSILQEATFVVAILAFAINLLFVVRFYEFDKVSVVKSLVLSLWLIHVIIFYTVLNVPAWRSTVSQQIGFTVWSQSLRFHGVFSIFLKEGLSYIMKRESLNEISRVLEDRPWKE